MVFSLRVKGDWQMGTGNILAGRLIQSIAIHWKLLIDALALSAVR